MLKGSLKERSLTVSEQICTRLRRSASSVWCFHIVLDLVRLAAAHRVEDVGEQSHLLRTGGRGVAFAWWVVRLDAIVVCAVQRERPCRSVEQAVQGVHEGPVCQALFH